MAKKESAITLLIIVLIVGIASWSKLRYNNNEGYDAPQRFTIEGYERSKAKPIGHN